MTRHRCYGCRKDGWKLPWAAGLLAASMACAWAGAPAPKAPSASVAREPQALLIEISTRAPGSAPAFDRRADRSYVVSTGGTGTRDASQGAGNGRVLETEAPTHLMHVRAGEALRVDLPSVQSLQFHVPMSVGSAGKASGTGSGTASSGGAGAGPSVAGNVYFEAVTAFSARFAIVDAKVLIHLQPLQVGGVTAPALTAGPPARPEPLVLKGPVGAWIALGDTQLPPARSLMPTAESPSPASVWVRVQPDPGQP